MKNFLLVVFSLLSLVAFSAHDLKMIEVEDNLKPTNKLDTVTFASGCFWCIEAKFSQLKGVQKVITGYTGGHVKNPTYKEVCKGTTGHAEAADIIYDSTIISYDELLEAFFLSHDPTQLNRQGNDIGTQYRSAIFYHNEEQRKKAQYYIEKLTEQRVYPTVIVTEVEPFTIFYIAESYHQQYYKQNPNQGYCRFVIQPELEKFKKIFKNKLKS
ncbi:peptide-methionine (S)-S-oxide reductase [Chryseobacterium sp. T16E-39]|uniref:peptide-methionine (S)-S-oxide reductase MsrA n=1 Tax=Chryseobacterium sp. T16E-39 TaxID=2015076 RepID=UPI000B5B15EA|nr:peptide-methionine (S)-S-oxide reductase MsrA [Chryseobacterium sp. T16E-39]ASK32637.1 peptide-methionine (S)-S-oxide reductase [Chryseobacterium sp. T16E-39]